MYSLRDAAFDPGNFEAPAVPASIAVITVNSIGVLGGIFLLIVFLKNRNLQNTPNYMVMSLAWADFWLQLTHLFVNVNVVARGRWAYWLCQMSGVTASYFGGTSLDGLAVLALERYFATVREKPVTPKVAMMMIGFTWAMQLWTSMIPFALGIQYQMEPSGVYCMARYSRTLPAWFTFTLISLLSIAVNEGLIVASYYLIYKKVVDIKKLLKNVGNSASSGTGKSPSADVGAKGGVASATGGAASGPDLDASHGTTAAVSLSASVASGFRMLLRGMSFSQSTAASASIGGHAAATEEGLGLSLSKTRTSWLRPSNKLEPPSEIREKASLTAGGKDSMVSASTSNAGTGTASRTRKASSLLRNINVFKKKKVMEDKRLETVLFRKSVIITGIFSFFWLPYLVNIAYQLITGSFLPSWYHTYAALCIYCNSMLNPFLYILLDTRWKKAAWDMLGISTEPKRAVPPPIEAKPRAKPAPSAAAKKPPKDDLDD